MDWDFLVNVMDVVFMGCYGWLGLLCWLGKVDCEIVCVCLEKV